MKISRPVPRKSQLCSDRMRLRKVHVQERAQVILVMEAQVIHSLRLIPAHAHITMRVLSVQSPEMCHVTSLGMGDIENQQKS